MGSERGFEAPGRSGSRTECVFRCLAKQGYDSVMAMWNSFVCKWRTDDVTLMISSYSLFCPSLLRWLLPNDYEQLTI